jgi:outer membrane scaffolding protein for murein synthesis (MipA/OmpV family)
MHAWITARWLLPFATILTPSLAGTPDFPSNSWSGYVAIGVLRATDTLTAGMLPEPTTSPWIDVRLERGRFFAATRRGIGYDLVKSEQLTVAAGAGFLPGRQEKDDPRLKGMGNVPVSPAMVASLDWHPLGDFLHAYISLASSVRHDRGSLLTAGTTMGFPVHGHLNGFLDVSTQLADRTFVGDFYGVTASQALRSGYREFHPKGGRLNDSVALGLVHPWSAHGSISGQIGRTWLRGEPLASPVMPRASYMNGSVAVRYSF